MLKTSKQTIFCLIFLNFHHMYAFFTFFTYYYFFFSQLFHSFSFFHAHKIIPLPPLLTILLLRLLSNTRFGSWLPKKVSRGARFFTTVVQECAEEEEVSEKSQQGIQKNLVSEFFSP